jgi:glycosyltransferase involved in cell wall biosynthesis
MLLALMSHWKRDFHWDIDVIFGADHPVPAELADLGLNLFEEPNPSDYDFAVVNTLVSAGFLDHLAPKVPTILWIHEGESALWSTDAPSMAWRSTFEKPAKIIFQTIWQAESVFRSFLFRRNPDTVACVRNGMPALPEGITPAPKERDKRRIVFIGGVYGRKRPGDLARAILALQRDDVECVYIGGTSNMDTLDSEDVQVLKSRPDKLIFLGEVERHVALSYLASADVFCLPSADESQPISPLEAAAFGVPSALSDLPPYSGIWKHGENCLLHPVRDSSLLQWNLRALLDDVAVRTKVVAGARDLLYQFGINRFFRRFDAELPI